MDISLSSFMSMGSDLLLPLRSALLVSNDSFASSIIFVSYAVAALFESSLNCLVLPDKPPALRALDPNFNHAFVGAWPKALEVRANRGSMYPRGKDFQLC